MRFSDMMGSGAEKPQKPEDDAAVVTDALAPYLGSAAPAEPEVASVPDEPTTWHASPVMPVPPLEGVVPAKTWVPDRAAPAAAPVPAPAPAPVVQYTTLSDDLLPHRRR